MTEGRWCWLTSGLIFSKSNDRLLVIDSWNILCNAWLTGDQWPVTGLWCLLVQWMNDQWPVDQWLVTGGHTLSTSTLGVAIWMGPTPGSRAMWGDDPIHIFFVWWIRHGSLFLILLSSHDPLSGSSFLGKFPGLICSETTSWTGWIPGTIRAFYVFVMIIPTRFYMTIFTTKNRHESRENSLQRTSDE